MKINQNISIKSTVVILCFLMARYSNFLFALAIGVKKWESLDQIISYSLILAFGLLIGLFLAAFLTGKFSYEPLGLKLNSMYELIYGFLFTIPMLLGFLFIFRCIYIIDLNAYFKYLVIAGFGEEFLFRGLLFGLLFKYCNWGFIPACIVSGLFFGAGHLYQASDIYTGLNVFLFTFFANLAFAFFYHVWGSLWMIISLHGFIDLIWALFPLTPDDKSNTNVNFFYFSAFIFTLIVTIVKFNNQDKGLFTSKLWVNREIS